MSSHSDNNNNDDNNDNNNNNDSGNKDRLLLPTGGVDRTYADAEVSTQSQEPNARRTLYMCFADLGGQNVKDQLKKKGAISQIKSD